MVTAKGIGNPVWLFKWIVMRNHKFVDVCVCVLPHDRPNDLCAIITQFLQPFCSTFFAAGYMKLIKTEMNLFLVAVGSTKIYCIWFLYYIDFFVYVFRLFFECSVCCLFYLLAFLINVILYFLPFFHWYLTFCCRK